MSLFEELKQTAQNPRLKRAIPYVAVGVLFIVAAVVAYTLAVTPAKEPYRKALAQYKNVYTANVTFSKLGAVLGASTATEQQFTDNIATVRRSLDALTAEVKALGEKDVLKEGEGQELYGAFSQQYQAYQTYNDNILTTIEAIRPVIRACNKSAADLIESVESAASLRACAVSLKDVQDVPDADYKAMVVSFIKSYDALADNISAAAALADPKGADKALQSTYEDDRTVIMNDLATTSSVLAKNLQTHRAEVDITQSAKALDDYLSKKSRIFF